MLPVHLDTIRLFLHVLGATIWVGGQLTLAGLVPVLRRISPDAPREAARRFNVIGWSAFALLVATGIWNITALGDHVSDSYRATLSAKLVVVAISGIAAFLHIRATSRRGLAVWGALTGLSALGALFLGMLLGS
ncbi:MAG TPA: hypothetical protein VFJ21_09795 [Mycobacteriales bacterium]|nr:hypothetical protein [Mycobacteriales bacterium]